MIYVVLDNIRSLYNVGSIFRTCDGFGINKLYLCGMTGFPPRPEIAKTALGAEESVEWEYKKNIIDLLSLLKKDGFKIVSIEKNDQSIDIKKYSNDNKDIVVVFGNEITGVQESVLNLSDYILHLPMQGIKESLNVSSCACAVLFQLKN